MTYQSSGGRVQHSDALISVSVSHRRKQWGFTIIELMVVIMMIGILASVTVPSFSKWKARMSMQEDSREVLSAIKSARMKAITMDEAMTFSIDGASHTYRVLDGDGDVYLNGTIDEAISITDNTIGASVQFDTKGMPSSSGSFKLNNSETYKTITLYITGASKIR